MLQKGVIVAFSFVTLVAIMVSLTSAHAEHAAPAVEQQSIWYRIFLFHDWLHPFTFLLMIYSCYSVRFFSSRKILREPHTCLGVCSQCYAPENAVKQYHRYFFWATFILLFIHVGEIIPSWLTFPLLGGLDDAVLISETAYLGFAFFYLGTCYHFRYALERFTHRSRVGSRLYNMVTDLNRYHGAFFWLTIISVATRFTLVMIATGSFLKAFPGTL